MRTQAFAPEIAGVSHELASLLVVDDLSLGRWRLVWIVEVAGLLPILCYLEYILFD